jgi:hypothetical protein
MVRSSHTSVVRSIYMHLWHGRGDLKKHPHSLRQLRAHDDSRNPAPLGAPVLPHLVHRVFVLRDGGEKHGDFEYPASVCPRRAQSLVQAPQRQDCLRGDCVVVLTDEILKPSGPSHGGHDVVEDDKRGASGAGRRSSDDVAVVIGFVVLIHRGWTRGRVIASSWTR